MVRLTHPDGSEVLKTKCGDKYDDMHDLTPFLALVTCKKCKAS